MKTEKEEENRIRIEGEGAGRHEKNEGERESVAFAFDSVALYIEQIFILTAIILRDDDFSFALYTPTLY